MDSAALLQRFGVPKSLLDKYPDNFKRLEEGQYELTDPKDGKFYLEGVISRNAADLRYWGYAAFAAADVRAMLDKLDGDAVMHLNSGGGDPTEASAIAAALLDYDNGNLTCFVTGIAGSAATYVMLACPKVQIMSSGEVFIHQAWGCVCGNAKELRNAADGLDTTSTQAASIYAQKTGKSVDEMMELMEGETYLSAEQSLEIGFADEIIQLVQDPPAPANDGDGGMREFASKAMKLRAMGVM